MSEPDPVNYTEAVKPFERFYLADMVLAAQWKSLCLANLAKAALGQAYALSLNDSIWPQPMYQANGLAAAEGLIAGLESILAFNEAANSAVIARRMAEECGVPPPEWAA